MSIMDRKLTDTKCKIVLCNENTKNENLSGSVDLSLEADLKIKFKASTIPVHIRSPSINSLFF